MKKFGLENSSHKINPTSTHLTLWKNESEVDVDQSLYRSMISSLLYLTDRKIDIIFAINVCSRYKAKPKDDHLTEVKRILKYINGAYEYGIIYSHDTYW